MRSGRIVMRAYGPPSVLQWETAELPPLAPGDVRIRTLAAAINHSDLEIRCGNWPVLRERPFPYVPGLEVVGELEGSGDRVITMMQGLGGVRAERDGGYAEHVTVRADTIARVPKELDPIDVAAVGLAGVTALGGLALAGSLRDKRVVVTGAGGGVGSAAVALAKRQGANVVAVVSRKEQSDEARALGADEVIAARTGEELKKYLEPWSVDVVLDGVAGPLFPVLVKSVRWGGTHALVGAVGGSNIELDAYHMLNHVTLTGYSTEGLDGPSLARAIDEITAAMLEKKLKAPARTVLPLEEAARAHQLLEDHRITGRIVLIPKG